MYKIFRSFLFLFQPEWVHYAAMNGLRLICSIPFGKKIIAKLYQPSAVEGRELFNLQFPNVVGLGAGFDKNARYLNELEALGFGFVEIGTVTPLPQQGNDKPRLFRLPKDAALINRMGFNNDGAAVIAQRLQAWQQKGLPLIIGGNIGKNKSTPNEDAWLDYEKCFLALHAYVHYFVVNVSSPNTPGLRALQEKDSLHKILTHLQQLNAQQARPKPILLKIAPDLTDTQLDDVIDLAMAIQLDGLVATNTTIERNNLLTSTTDIAAIGAGGLSGRPVTNRSTEVVAYIHQKTNGRLPIIASGGIFDAKDAKEKIEAGGSLLQVWTGFVYEGPSIVKNICNHL
jgi:dihydroorotate dehydrogenase